MRHCEKCGKELSEGQAPDCVDVLCPHPANSSERTLLDTDGLDRAAVLRFAAELAANDEDSTRLDEGPLDVTKLYDDDEERPAYLDEIIRRQKAKNAAKALIDAMPDDEETGGKDSTIAYGLNAPIGFGAEPMQQTEPAPNPVSLDDLEGDDGPDPTMLAPRSDLKRPRLTLSELRANLKAATNLADERAASLDGPITETEESEVLSDDDFDDDDRGDRTAKMSAVEVNLVAEGLDEATGPQPLPEGTAEIELVPEGTHEIDLVPEGTQEVDHADILDEFDPLADGATVEIAALRGAKTTEDQRLDPEAIDAAIALVSAPRPSPAPQPSPVPAPYGDPYGSGLGPAPYGYAPPPSDPYSSQAGSYPQGPWPQPGPYAQPGGYPPPGQHPYPSGPGGYAPPDPYGSQTYPAPPGLNGPAGPPVAPRGKAAKAEIAVIVAIVIVAIIGVILTAIHLSGA